MLAYALDKTRSEPVYIQIYQHIRADIALGNIAADEKLPSKRTLATSLGVSVITVENAYGQLLAEGYIRSEEKRGYFVEKHAAVQKTAVLPAEQSPVSELPEAAEQFPFRVWAKLMREELAYHQEQLLTKPPCEGVLVLREAIAWHLKRFRNLNVSPEQIIIGAGTEYLYMLIHMLLGHQSIIAVEEPGYSKIAEIYGRLGSQCRWIPMEQDGIQIEALQASDAEVVHISPSHHFPTGIRTSVAKRYALLGWAAEGHYLIEDDYDSEFQVYENQTEHTPSLFSMDVTERVIYMNTFSQSLTPTIRISYMILPPTLLKQYHERLHSCSCPVSTFEQYTLARFIREGYFERHLHRLSRLCRERQEVFLSKLLAWKEMEAMLKNPLGIGFHCTAAFRTELTDEQLLQTVTSAGFRADKLRNYFHEPPAQELHQLVLYY